MHREKLIKSVSKENFGQRYTQYIFQYDVFQNNNSILLFILSSTPPPPHTKRLRKYTHKHFFACIICKLENYLSKKTHFSHMLMCIKKNPVCYMYRYTHVHSCTMHPPIIHMHGDKINSHCQSVVVRGREFCYFSCFFVY